ncbi:hypothetical protein [Cupriavidus sp. D39]|uniref:hypothetical protein n=1 Tax=Cupriavidus sp. D39 TaxID=2997877 RepID=UPI002272169B|nr:hypothetical protein [Cupriavidus sp. D39]MCY0855952.1 hypothetical protein [Cupriavidus sp. D39]
MFRTYRQDRIVLRNWRARLQDIQLNISPGRAKIDKKNLHALAAFSLFTWKDVRILAGAAMDAHGAAPRCPGQTHKAKRPGQGRGVS